MAPFFLLQNYFLFNLVFRSFRFRSTFSSDRFCTGNGRGFIRLLVGCCLLWRYPVQRDLHPGSSDLHFNSARHRHHRCQTATYTYIYIYIDLQRSRKGSYSFRLYTKEMRNFNSHITFFFLFAKEFNKIK